MQPAVSTTQKYWGLLIASSLLKGMFMYLCVYANSCVLYIRRPPLQRRAFIIRPVENHNTLLSVFIHATDSADNAWARVPSTAAYVCIHEMEIFLPQETCVFAPSLCTKNKYRIWLVSWTPPISSFAKLGQVIHVSYLRCCQGSAMASGR